MQMQNGANIAALELFFIIRIAQERQNQTLHAYGRLHAIRNEFLVGGGIEVFKRLARMLGMLGQVVIRAVGHAPKLAPAEREQVFEVGGRLGIERQLFGLMVAQAQVVFLHAQAQQPVFAEGTPVIEPIEVLAGLAEEFKLHLLEFTHAENEVAGGDFVAEGLADLADAGRQLFAGGAHGIQEIHENALSGFGAQIDFVGSIFRYARMGLEHQIELANAGEILFAANGANDVVLGDIFFQFGVGPAVAGFIAVGEILDELIRTEAGFARLAVHQRIVESADMAGSHPNFAIHQNGAVQTRIIGRFLNEFLPPGALDIVFEFNAERAEIPSVGQSAVNFGTGENKAAVFAQSNQLIHCKFRHCILLASQFSNLKSSTFHP